MKQNRPRQPARRPPARKSAAALPPPQRAASPPPPAFAPVPLRARHDGWTPGRQAAFIQALGETACVVDACAAVGMSESSAYALRARPDAISFRNAWDSALDYAVRRLSDHALSRVIKGVAVPVFFQGEQIGERRYYDERLTMFLLRYRDPLRYGKWRDRQEISGHAEYAAARLQDGVEKTRADAALPPEEAARSYRKRVREIGRDLAESRGEDPDDVHPPEEDQEEEEEGGRGGAGGEEEGDVA